jgi:dihydrofolate reductase
MKSERKLTLYIAMSLDGYIADKQDGLGFLSTVEKEGEDYGYTDFVKTTDTIIIGRKSYEKVLSMGYKYPHTDKKVYIITRTKRPDVGNFQFYNGNLSQLVNELKSQSGKHIYCDGGAEIANELLSNNLIDELIISIIPVLLGDGVRLFKDGRPTQDLQLLSTKQFEKGLTQLYYNIKKKESILQTNA